MHHKHFAFVCVDASVVLTKYYIDLDKYPHALQEIGQRIYLVIWHSPLYQQTLYKRQINKKVNN